MSIKEDSREAVYHCLRYDEDYREKAFGALDILERSPCLKIQLLNQTSYVSIEYKRLFCHAFTDDVIHLADKIMTAFSWQRFLRGDYLCTALSTQRGPFRDKKIEENDKILKDMMKLYNKTECIIEDAYFEGGNYGEDGMIKFNEPPIFANQIWRRNDGGYVRESFVSGRADVFPLEVGYCLPYQMDMHLYSSGCVARFPYGCNFIILMERIGKHWAEE